MFDMSLSAVRSHLSARGIRVAKIAPNARGEDQYKAWKDDKQVVMPCPESLYIRALRVLA